MGSRRKASAIGPGYYASCSVTWAYDPADLMVLEVSVSDEDAVWSLWQAPRDELQGRFLRSGGKALPSSSDNYFPFEKQLSSWPVPGPE